MFGIIVIFILFVLPYLIVYLKEKRNTLNSEKNDIKFFIKKFLNINFTFNNRINRYEFIIYGGFLFWGPLIILFGIGGILDERGYFSDFDQVARENFLIVLLMSGFGFAVIIHQYAVYIKRLHDLNKSGWNVLWAIIPILGYLYLAFICFFFKGAEGSNDYGSDPNDKYQEKPNPLKNAKNKSNNTFSDIFSNNKNKIAKRLEELKQLLDDNAISKEEYEEQRRKIIKDV